MDGLDQLTHLQAGAVSRAEARQPEQGLPGCVRLRAFTTVSAPLPESSAGAPICRLPSSQNMVGSMGWGRGRGIFGSAVRIPALFCSATQMGSCLGRTPRRADAGRGHPSNNALLWKSFGLVLARRLRTRFRTRLAFFSHWLWEGVLLCSWLTRGCPEPPADAYSGPGSAPHHAVRQAGLRLEPSRRCPNLCLEVWMLLLFRFGGH